MKSKKSLGKKFLYYVILMFLISTSLILAQDNFATKGVVELGGNISLQSITPVIDGNTGNSTSVFTVSPFIGIFATDGFEIGLNPLGITHISSSGYSITQIRILVAPSYNFKTNGNSYPFIEALLGYTSQSNSSTYSGFSWGGRTGVKIGVTDKGLLNLGIQYLLVTLNHENSNERNGQNELSVSVGFTISL
jgi:hypothetical protein